MTQRGRGKKEKQHCSPFQFLFCFCLVLCVGWASRSTTIPYSHATPNIDPTRPAKKKTSHALVWFTQCFATPTSSRRTILVSHRKMEFFFVWSCLRLNSVSSGDRLQLSTLVSPLWSGILKRHAQANPEYSALVKTLGFFFSLSLFCKRSRTESSVFPLFAYRVDDGIIFNFFSFLSDWKRVVRQGSWVEDMYLYLLDWLKHRLDWYITIDCKGDWCALPPGWKDV